MRYYILKNPAIWLANSIFTHNSRIRIFQCFHFRLFPQRTNNKTFQKNTRKLFWGHFGPFFPNMGKNTFSWKKRTLSVFKYSNHLPSQKKSEKTKKHSWVTCRTDRRTDRQTNKQIDNSDFIGSSVKQESNKLKKKKKGWKLS